MEFVTYGRKPKGASFLDHVLAPSIAARGIFSRPPLWTPQVSPLGVPHRRPTVPEPNAK